MCHVVFVLLVDLLGDDQNLILLHGSELIFHDDFVLAAIDVAQIQGPAFVATVHLRNSENSAEQTVNQIEVIVNHGTSGLGGLEV